MTGTMLRMARPKRTRPEGKPHRLTLFLPESLIHSLKRAALDSRDSGVSALVERVMREWLSRNDDRSRAN